LLELAHENAKLEAIHAHGESQQLKIGLPLAFAKCPNRNSFKIIKRANGIIASVNCVENVPEDLF
jgi:hypothetical protein